MKTNKTKTIGIRVTPDEYQEIKEDSKKAGFDSVATFILWVLRGFKK